MSREVEWDDVEREKMLARAAYRAGVHMDGCGFHESVATDRANVFEPVVELCPLCAQVEQMGRAQAAKDAKASEGSDKAPSVPLPSDGRHVHIRMLSPAEAEQVRAKGGRRGAAS